MDKALPHRVMSIMPGILTAITKPERTEQVKLDEAQLKECREIAQWRLLKGLNEPKQEAG